MSSEDLVVNATFHFEKFSSVSFVNYSSPQNIEMLVFISNDYNKKILHVELSLDKKNRLNFLSS